MMTPLETQIVQLLQQDDEDEASIAARLGCSLAKVKVVAGKYLVTSAQPGEGRAAEAKRRRETRSYHVTSVLSAEESRKYMEPLPTQVSVPGKDGGPALTLVMDYPSALTRRDGGEPPGSGD